MRRQIIKISVFIALLSMSLSIAAESFALELNFDPGAMAIQSAPAGPVAAVPKKKQRLPVKIDVSQRFYYNRIAGDETRSFLPRGDYYETQISALYEHAFKDPKWILNARADVRYTNDPTIQNEPWKMQSLLINYGRKDEYMLQIGNISLRGSRYIYNRSADGAVYHHYFYLPQKTKLTFDFGVGRIEHRVDGSRFSRYGLGTGITVENKKIDTSFVKRYKGGIYYSQVMDDRASLHKEEGIKAERNNVLGFNFDALLFWDLQTKGEFAVSRYREDYRAERVVDEAYYIDMTKKFKFGTLRASYENIDPNFHSLIGSGSPDSRRKSLSFNTRYKKYITANAGVTHYRDNLGNKKKSTSENWSPYVNVSYSPFADSKQRQCIKDVKFTGSFRLTKYDNNFKTTDRDVMTHRYGVSDTFGDWKVDLKYHHRDTRDFLNRDNDSKEDGIQTIVSNPKFLERILRSKKVTGGPRVSVSFTKDGLRSNPDKNLRTKIDTSFNGKMPWFRYNTSYGWERGRLSDVTNNFEKYTWKAEISRSVKFTKVLEPFNFTAGLRGSNTHDWDALREYEEFTAELKVNTKF